MLKTGMKKLDSLTGGISQDSTTMLLGPANIGKLEFCFQFIWQGLKNGQPSLLILTRNTPKEIISKFKRMGCEIEDYLEKELIKIIDCYSAFIGIRATPYIVKVSGPSDLTSLSFQISNALKIHQRFQKPIRFVLHSLSTLFLYNTPESMMRFFTHLIGMSKTMNATLLFTIERIIGEEMAHKISELAEGIIEFKTEKGMFLLSPKRMGKKIFDQRIQYKVSDKGLRLV